MIKLLRIDDRLIHGQIATTWIKTLMVNSIIVANDKVVEDELQVIALKMAVPYGIKIAIKSIDDALKLISDPRFSSLDSLVIVNNPRDALTIAKNNIELIEEINIGNYYGNKDIPENKKIKFDKSVFLDPEDLDVLREICELPLEFNFQLVPNENKRKVSSSLKNF